MSLSLSCTRMHAAHTRAESPSGSFCMNYRVWMRGYEMPSAQEAVHSHAALMETAAALQIKIQILIIKNLHIIASRGWICLAEVGLADFTNK